MVKLSIKKTIALAFAILGLSLNAAISHSSDNEAVPHYPIEQPVKQEWSFSGPFGVYDKNQLQRGFKVYQEVCSVCHSLKFVSFRHLKGIGLDDEKIKALAAGYEVPSEPDEEGEIKMRPAQPVDYFPKPFANDKLAAFANNGAVPADLSLMARARSIPAPFPGFIGDVFTNYTSAGPDYIYALLTGYSDAPSGHEITEGTYYNPYFNASDAIAMSQPLYDDSVVYEDGSPQTLDQYAKDVSAFLMWASDPHMEQRKKTGFRVIVFLIMFAGLAYYSKRRIWAEKK
ncbi:cytochrome c1 [Bartonella sp. HY761]|uniref:cytochrome c1 n=1 Tax=Bartonella sp. HY761 TaxID=2979330 RepID=UPI0021FD2CD3|nr:cytochrome c1 [Bartonella sp. HY761]UXN05647.1 cytochrome c1 [Bartonella sp. HY761]